MFRNLLPKSTDFFDYFEQHSRLGVEACQELLAMFSGSQDMVVRAARIKEIEREADTITHTCTDVLHRTFITPFDRGDILGLIQKLDDVVDAIESIASRLVLYEITEERPEARALAEVLVKASQAITRAVAGLTNLSNPEEIKRNCIVLFDLENQGDELMRSALAKLLKEEANAITVIKWKEIFERLEKATDRCEAVADLLQGIVIEAA
ncbi:MAG TPA: DUF47 family protein [Candidatus Hydrogenedentes bacterium]|nr:DUF47 family protein [Candidatus Hydrogenedentota bacterium]